MLQLWLQFALGLGLAMAGWISSLDTTGSSGTASALWLAAAIVAAHLVFRLLKAER